MKTRKSLIILVLLVLPFILAACGGGPAGEAKKFLEATFDGDKDEAAKHVCDKNKELLLTGADAAGNMGVSTKMDKIECKEAGEDVKCTVKGKDEEGNPIDETITFGMEDGKVCEVK